MHEVGWSGDFQGGVEELGGFGAECGLQAVPHLSGTWREAVCASRGLLSPKPCLRG